MLMKSDFKLHHLILLFNEYGTKRNITRKICLIIGDNV